MGGGSRKIVQLVEVLAMQTGGPVWTLRDNIKASVVKTVDAFPAIQNRSGRNIQIE